MYFSITSLNCLQIFYLFFVFFAPQFCIMLFFTRFYKGCKNKDAYRFYSWSGVNAFTYFSHSLVTIPPPGWIHAAHLHGVKVLGKFLIYRL